MQMGLGVVGAQSTATSPRRPSTETTPIAKLIEESEAIVVPADSPYKTLDDLVDGVEGQPGQHPRSAAPPTPVAPTT